MGGYRYGFNGKENDNEIKGEGNQQDYGMRVYDPRIAKFLSVDPITKQYPELTPYQFASNTPIWAVDLDGLEASPFQMMRTEQKIRENRSKMSPEELKKDDQLSLITGVAVSALPFAIYTSIASVPALVTVSANKLAAVAASASTVALWTSRNPQLVNEAGSFVAGLLDPGPGETNPNASGDEMAKVIKGVAGKFLFRGDTRGLHEIFNKGFESKGLNKDVMEYVEANVPSIFVSTSKSVEQAAEKGKGGFVYIIDNEGGKGFDVNNFYKALGDVNPYAKELEVIFESKIEVNKIIGAIKVGEDGKLDNKMILNPNYIAPKR